MSNQIKPTPGPWCVNGWPVADMFIEGTDENGRALHIARVPRHSLGNDTLKAREQVANAYMLAASPLMFQTLESVAETLTIWEAEQGLSETESALLRDVLAAIAAAKGETV